MRQARRGASNCSAKAVWNPLRPDSLAVPTAWPLPRGASSTAIQSRRAQRAAHHNASGERKVGGGELGINWAPGAL
jgi:hypothetical protein